MPSGMVSSVLIPPKKPPDYTLYTPIHPIHHLYNRRKFIMTVLEACAMLELGDGIKPNIELTFGSSGVPFNPKTALR